MESRTETGLRSIAFMCAVMTAAVSAAALAGWTIHSLIIASIRSDYIPMAPSTALCFLVLSGVLLVLLSSPHRLSVRIGANAGLVLVWIFCLYVLLSFFAGRLPEIEHALFGASGSLGPFPLGHMSPFTAVSLMLACASELLLLITTSGQRRYNQASAYLAATLVLIGFVMVLGYLYGTPLLYGGTIIPVALTTALVLFFTGVGLLAASGGEVFPVRSFIGPSVRSRLMRAFFPVALFAILFSGWLDAAIMLPIIKNHALTSSLVALGSAVIFGIIITKMSDSIGSSIDKSSFELKRAERELSRVNRALKTLSEGNQVLARSTNETDFLRDICGIIIEFGGYRMSMVGFAEQNEGKSVRAMASAGYEEGFFDKARLTWADTEAGRGPIGTAIRTREISFFRNVLSDAYPAPWREAARKRGYVSAIGLPLLVGTEIVGALAIYASEHEAFDEKEVELLAELSLDISYGIAALRARAERERAELALRKSEERLKRLLESITNYVYTVQLERGRPVSTMHGASCVSVTGYTAEDFDEDPYLWFSMIHEEDRVTVVGHIESFLAEGNASSLEHRIFRKGGAMRWVKNTLVPKFDEQGRLVAYDGLVSDITERKTAEEVVRQYNEELEKKVKERTRELELNKRELEHARLLAEAASRAKSDFLANMSHELRTPLNSIIGFSEVLHDGLYGPLNEKQESYVSHIYSSGSHLLSLINDILDLAKVESGKSKLELSTVPLHNILQGAVLMLQEKAMKQGIAMRLDVAPGAAININTDERKLKQIMFNLLGNAVKFTPEGGAVSVRARKVRNNAPQPPLNIRGGEGEFIELAVSDTGIGIKPENMDMLFKPFSQLESAYTKTYEGTGLGLALTKRLVEFLGGRIWVESEFGKGSVFTVVIPVNSEHAQERK